jgi:hypothetical protein
MTSEAVAACDLGAGHVVRLDPQADRVERVVRGRCPGRAGVATGWSRDLRRPFASHCRRTGSYVAYSARPLIEPGEGLRPSRRTGRRTYSVSWVCSNDSSRSIAAAPPGNSWQRDMRVTGTRERYGSCSYPISCCWRSVNHFRAHSTIGSCWCRALASCSR